MMVIELLFLGSEGAMLVDATLCLLCFGVIQSHKRMLFSIVHV